MNLTLTEGRILGLFSAMVVLASLPSISVLTVWTRSVTSGFIHGVFTTMGIVLGDIIFILVSLYGLSMIAEANDTLFRLIRYGGAIYLIYLGWQLWRVQVRENIAHGENSDRHSFLSSFMAGLSITLADQKAVFFYLGFFPAFLDLNKISYLDTLVIIFISIVTVGGVKTFYAFMADRTKTVFMVGNLAKVINSIGAIALILVGLSLLVSS